MLMSFQVDSPGTVLISILLDILALDNLRLDILGLDIHQIMINHEDTQASTLHASTQPLPHGIRSGILFLRSDEVLHVVTVK